MLVIRGGGGGGGVHSGQGCDLRKGSHYVAMIWVWAQDPKSISCCVLSSVELYLGSSHTPHLSTHHTGYSGYYTRYSGYYTGY